MNTDVPYRSNSLMRSFQPSDATAALSGAVKKIKMTIIVTTPIGRLMKKHHLHVAADTLAKSFSSRLFSLTFISKDTAQQGPGNTGNSIHGTNEASIHGPLDERNTVGHYNERAREDTSTAKTCDGSSDDQGNGIGCHSADKTSQFEYPDGGEVDPFD